MKKTISILMALIMIFSVLSVGASALNAPVEIKHAPIGDVSVIRYAPDTELPTHTSAPQVNRFASSDPNTPYTFYAQLPDSMSRDIYNGLAGGAKPQAKNVITLSQKISVTCTVEMLDGELYLVVPDWFSEKLVQGVFAAASALMDDHPEMFWIGNFDMVDFDSTLEPVVDEDRGTVTVQVDTILIDYALPAGYQSWDAVKTAYTQMMQTANGVQIAGANRFEKLKNIHDWIAKRVVYDDNFGPTCFEATSVFLAPYKTVCEGYSEAFKMLCDRAGIPCIVIVGDAGEPHAWNYVKMEDGNWYAVDVTWDDQNDENGADLIFYDFFLRGANSTEIFFHGENEAPTAFKNTHKPQGDRYADANGNAIYRLTYPALAEEGYTRMLLAPNSKATVDKASMTVSIPEGTDIAQALLIPDGYKGFIDADPASILQIAVPLMYGDVNGDGAVNAVDARWALQAASGVRTLTEAQRILANVNGDSTVNAVDARWILQAASGVRTLPASDEPLVLEEYQVAWLKAA